VQGGFPYFKNEILCDLWIGEVQLTKLIKKMELFACCLNYDHFHVVIKLKDSIANYSKVMQFLKRHSSRNINIILGYNIYDTQKHSTEGDIGQYRLREEMKNFDQIVLKLRESFKQKYGEIHDIPKFKWQKSFYDHVIRNKKDYEKHYLYTMYNYLKHELPDDWKYTGLRRKEMTDEFDE